MMRLCRKKSARAGRRKASRWNNHPDRRKARVITAIINLMWHGRLARGLLIHGRGAHATFKCKPQSRYSLLTLGLGLARHQRPLQVAHRLLEAMLVLHQGDSPKSFAIVSKCPAPGQRNFRP